MRSVLRRVGLARLMRMGLTLGIAPLWYELTLLHFRGAFQSRFMWVPVLSLPAVIAGGVASGLKKDERHSRNLFRPFAQLMTLLGTVGTFFHLRGVSRQMGGFYNWKYNIVTGPPFPAPMQVALYGLVGVIASRHISKNPFASKQEDEREIIRGARRINSLSYLLLGIESGFYHWTGNFFNRLMFTPVLLSPVLALIHLASLWRSRLARTLEFPLSVLTALVGIVGFSFHVGNLLGRPGRLTWQNLFYGAPIMAPLQMTGQGVLGVLLALFSKNHED
jgi:hypothetical protein